MNKQEALDALKSIDAAFDTVGKEISGLNAEVATLQAAAKADTVGDDLANAINAVANRAGTLAQAHADATATVPDVNAGATAPTLTPTPPAPEPTPETPTPTP